jgi:hypothetical protein
MVTLTMVSGWSAMTKALVLLVAGACLLVFGVVLFVVRARIRRRAARAQGQPKRRLSVYFPARTSAERPGGMVDLAGMVVSPPQLRAPLSGKECALWELSLAVIVPATYDSDEGRTTVWVTGRSCDLVVEYDERFDITEGPGKGRFSRVPSGSGRVEIPGDKVSFRLPGDASRDPMPGLSWILSEGEQPANPVVLQEFGLPADLLAQVRANPDGYVVTEGSIAQGEFVRLGQGPTARGRGPDPSQPFFVYPLSQEFIGSFGAGCVGMVLAIVGTGAGLIGALLLWAGLRQLLGADA